jgi:hypothetical protein
MAHFSALSPDRKQVLIVEMQPGSEFSPCRQAPFDGSSKGRQVGPVPGYCIAAAWSPDGKWMYFSARREKDKFHLWRQRLEGGEPEQITFGPTQEEGLAIAPDGKSVITSVGVDQDTVWIHDANGERQISGEGNAGFPQFAPDGRRIYYLSPPDIWATDLASGQAERVLPGVAVARFVLSHDGKAIAYSASDSSLWYAAVDRGTPPHLLAQRGINPQFTGSGDILFRATPDSILYRVHPDGTGSRAVPGNPGDSFRADSPLSPDEELSLHRGNNGALLASPRNGGRPIAVCVDCDAGWSSDGGFFWITMSPRDGTTMITGLIPLENKSALPPVPRGGVRGRADLIKIPGVQVISSEDVSPAPVGSDYAFWKKESRWNLYRISLP